VEVLDWTVRELAGYAAGQARRRDDELRLAMWSAWHIAQLSRVKRMPPLERLMRKIGRRKVVRKTTEQLLATAKQITALMRGRREP
jgi:hypothetical protein